MRKQSRSLHHGSTKDSGPILFSVHIWSGFQHMAGSTPHHVQHTHAPPHHKTQPSQECPAPLFWQSVKFSRWKHCPACSSLQLIPKEPCLHLPLQWRGHLGADPPLTWATKGDANCFVLVITTYQILGTGENTPKPGLKPGINPAYIRSSFLPYLRDCKAHQQNQAPFPQPLLTWQQDYLYELPATYTAKELQDRALNCLKIHYPPIVT